MIVIKENRDFYNVVWDTILAYCEKHSLIVSDIYQLSNQTNDKHSIYAHEYRIYTSNPFRHANSLTNQIYQNTVKLPESRFTRLKTKTEHEEFIIQYNLRTVATLYKLQKHKNTEPVLLIKPVKIKDILYMPPEIELIDVYHKLYDVSKYDEYDESLLFEKALYQQVVTRKDKGMLVGAHDNLHGNEQNLSLPDRSSAHIQHTHNKLCKERRKELIESLKITLIKDWLPKRSNTVLIGPWAYNWIRLGSNICVDIEKVQIISDVTPVELLKTLQKYVSSLTKFEISYREQELHIPKDFRTSRYTYYLHIHSDKGIVQKPFLDLFNCADFEVVPYVTVDNILVGYKWVLLRFLFIDLWIIRVIKTLGLLSEEILNKKLKYIWQLIEFFRMFDMGAVSQYLGIYRDYAIDKSINSMQQEKKFYPYYPAIYVRDNNRYREI